MTRVIAHIGDGKCGSSSIQRSLFNAKDALQEQGIFYPVDPGVRNHFPLAINLGRVTRAPKVGNAIDVTVDAVRQAALVAGPSDTIILSAESLFLFNAKDVSLMIRDLIPNISELHVLAYVRQPTSMYMSLVQQKLKASFTFKQPDAYCRPINRPLRQWLRSGQAKSVTARKFSRNALTGGDAVTDFAHCVEGILGRPVPLQATSVNSSLSIEQIIVLQEIRQVLPAEAEDKFHPVSNRAISMFQDLNRRAFVGTRPALSDLAWRVIANTNRAVVESVAADFPDIDLIENAAPVLPEQLAQAPWRTDDSVAAISESSDEALVGQIRALIPELTPEQGPGARQIALKSFLQRCPEAGRPAMKKRVHRYWATAGEN